MPKYQNGSLEEIRTAEGLCWFIRFTAPDGSRPRERVGTKAQFPTRQKASRAAQHLRDRYNNFPEVVMASIRTMGDVIARYEREEMPERHSTQRGYRNIHRTHLTPRWGATLLSDLQPMNVRAWLQELSVAPRTRGHIHAQMRLLYRFAMLWGWTPAQVNPMSLFTLKGTSKRSRTPKIITPEQFKTLLSLEPKVERQTILIAAYCLGLRASELFALKWLDFDHFEKRVVISRAIVEGHIGEVKTERSGASLPLPAFVADAFLRWRASSPNTDEWVFLGGTLQLPPNVSWLQHKWLKPLGKLAGLDFPVGFHTFRHSFKTLLVTAGIDVTIQRDLMRHADIQTTLQTYGENKLEPMREASDKALSILFPN